MNVDRDVVNSNEEESDTEDVPNEYINPSTPKEDTIVLDTSVNKTGKLCNNTTIRNNCTACIDQILEGDFLAIPDFINALILYFGTDLPPASEKNLFAAQMAAKASYVLKYTWEKGNSNEAAAKLTNSGSESKLRQTLLNKAETFAMGILVGTGPFRGMWIGITANNVKVQLPFNENKVMEWINRFIFFIVVLSYFMSENIMIEVIKFCLEFMFGLHKSRESMIKYGVIWCVISYLQLSPETCVVGALSGMFLVDKNLI